ncbi:hypothetical protein RFI_23379 [Reticulomyxa filosa]|uniref:RING-type E3 ubiquitin transferase n=1 Tax=Reticulomyxa filosa TaxID=46433 RepID=X6MJ06_RETFI|nr:hypothetical protein RFI_23379 [Reticulomyxa filosa]|eukprot:ETO13988.1 hypothetical protein RFI_23379 [Reticulomyxa filosa]
MQSQMQLLKGSRGNDESLKKVVINNIKRRIGYEVELWNPLLINRVWHVFNMFSQWFILNLKRKHTNKLETRKKHIRQRQFQLMMEGLNENTTGEYQKLEERYQQLMSKENHFLHDLPINLPPTLASLPEFMVLFVAQYTAFLLTHEELLSSSQQMNPLPILQLFVVLLRQPLFIKNPHVLAQMHCLAQYPFDWLIIQILDHFCEWTTMRKKRHTEFRSNWLHSNFMRDFMIGSLLHLHVIVEKRTALKAVKVPIRNNVCRLLLLFLDKDHLKDNPYNECSTQILQHIANDPLACQSRVTFVSHIMDDLTHMFDEMLSLFNTTVDCYQEFLLLGEVNRENQPKKLLLYQQLSHNDRKCHTFVNLVLNLLRTLELSASMEFFRTNCLLKTEVSNQTAQFLTFYMNKFYKSVETIERLISGSFVSHENFVKQLNETSQQSSPETREKEEKKIESSSSMAPTNAYASTSINSISSSNSGNSSNLNNHRRSRTLFDLGGRRFNIGLPGVSHLYETFLHKQYDTFNRFLRTLMLAFFHLSDCRLFLESIAKCGHFDLPLFERSSFHVIQFYFFQFRNCWNENCTNHKDSSEEIITTITIAPTTAVTTPLLPLRPRQTMMETKYNDSVEISPIANDAQPSPHHDMPPASHSLSQPTQSQAECIDVPSGEWQTQKSDTEPSITLSSPGNGEDKIKMDLEKRWKLVLQGLHKQTKFPVREMSKEEKAHLEKNIRIRYRMGAAQRMRKFIKSLQPAQNCKPNTICDDAAESELLLSAGEKLKRLWMSLHCVIEEQQHEIQNLDSLDIPLNFLDPLMHTLMEDPVTLPSSQVNLDRSTIMRHLLSNHFDPFTRAPLTEEGLISNHDLKKAIVEFKKRHIKSNSSE